MANNRKGLFDVFRDNKKGRFESKNRLIDEKFQKIGSVSLLV
jgi:hypothetical protein